MTDPLQARVVAALGEHYEVEGEIGRGGMAVVYRALDRRLNRRVAIKVLPPELAYDPAIRTRFTREAQTAAQLSHPHIVPIYDVGERDGVAYFVMAEITGGNLAALLANEPRQPIDEVRRLICEIADALAYAHTRGVIHRDIKPDNILLDGDTGRAMVTDFGIARAIEAGSRLTVTGNAVGTPTYMSPEQATGERLVDGRSDIYSLGVIGYQMLVGRVPFAASNSMALMLKHVSERPVPISELRPDAPRSLQEAVERALLKAPDDRWPSASALRDMLLSQRSSAAPWRTSAREPVRFNSPIPSPAPQSRRREQRRNRSGELVLPQLPDANKYVVPQLVMEAPAYSELSAEQKADLRLWHGRTQLLDRIKAIRGYSIVAVATAIAGVTLAVAGAAEGIPPAVFAIVPPYHMLRKLWKRSQSLRAAGLTLRRVFLMPRAKWVIKDTTPKTAAPTLPKPGTLERLVAPEILASPEGQALRRAAQDRASLMAIYQGLPKPERVQLIDVEPTSKALLERAAHLAQLIHRLDENLDGSALVALEARIAAAESDASPAEASAPERQRRLTLLRHQRASIQELSDHRDQLARQFDSACLALGNLYLDLVKFRSSGQQSMLADLSNATQEARALSRDIGYALQAAGEVRDL